MSANLGQSGSKLQARLQLYMKAQCMLHLLHLFLPSLDSKQICFTTNLYLATFCESRYNAGELYADLSTNLQGCSSLMDGLEKVFLDLLVSMRHPVIIAERLHIQKVQITPIAESTGVAFLCVPPLATP